jgi:hypothetical protein
MVHRRPYLILNLPRWQWYHEGDKSRNPLTTLTTSLRDSENGANLASYGARSLREIVGVHTRHMYTPAFFDRVALFRISR